MKKKLLYGWTPIRLFYLLMGSFLMIQSLMNKVWISSIISGYFMAMGLFGFGCASGQCNISGSPVIKKEDPG